MRKFKLASKFTALLLSGSMLLSQVGAAGVYAAGFDKDYLNSDGMQLGYDIINGYSRLAVKNGLLDSSTSAVYSGLDAGSPYLLALLGIFYVTKGVDIDRAMGDNNYTMELISGLDSFLGRMGVKNERAQSLRSTLEADGVKIEKAFDTAGLYIISCDKEYYEGLSKNENVDFTLAGGKMPPSLKDLNFDGRSDEKDSEYIQRYLTGELSYSDRQENEYLKFACDINGDKSINILDATQLDKLSR